MQTDNTNLTMVRGDTETINVSFDGYTLIDGDTIEFTVRKNAKAKNSVIHKTITDFTSGTATIPISHNDTKDLDFGIYWYDVQLTTSIGQIYTIVPWSMFTIGKEATYE